MLNLNGTNGFLGKLNQPVKYNSTFIWTGTILTYVSFQSFWDLMSSTGLQNTILKNSFLFILENLDSNPERLDCHHWRFHCVMKSTHIWINLESESGWHKKVNFPPFFWNYWAASRPFIVKRGGINDFFPWSPKLTKLGILKSPS